MAQLAYVAVRLRLLRGPVCQTIRCSRPGGLIWFSVLIVLSCRLGVFPAGPVSLVVRRRMER
jgi:hypothetical protein